MAGGAGGAGPRAPASGPRAPAGGPRARATAPCAPAPTEAPAEAALPLGQVGTAPSRPEGPVGWLASIARAIRAALADGAVREVDAAGGLCLVRLDGRRLAVAPHTVAELAAAGLLPALPDPVDEAAEDDPVDAAEREAIAAVPDLPPEGTPERARLDAAQAATVAGLLAASRVRPSCFEGTAASPPPKGAYCSACRGRRWWTPAQPKTDGTGVSPHWRCVTCHPPARPRENQLVRIET